MVERRGPSPGLIATLVVLCALVLGIVGYVAVKRYIGIANAITSSVPSRPFISLSVQAKQRTARITLRNRTSGEDLAVVVKSLKVDGQVPIEKLPAKSFKCPKGATKSIVFHFRKIPLKPDHYSYFVNFKGKFSSGGQGEEDSGSS